MLAADRPHVCPSRDWPSAAPPSPPRPPWKPIGAQVEAKERSRQRGMLGASPLRQNPVRPVPPLALRSSIHPLPFIPGRLIQPCGQQVCSLSPLGRSKSLRRWGGNKAPSLLLCAVEKEMGRLYQTHLCTHERRTDRQGRSICGRILSQRGPPSLEHFSKKLSFAASPQSNEKKKQKQRGFQRVPGRGTFDPQTVKKVIILRFLVRLNHIKTWWRSWDGL